MLVTVGALAAFGIGYLVAALFIFPAPLLSGRRAVPRLIGLTLEEAQEKLVAASLDATAADEESSDLIPAGQVIWQEPPAGVVVPERTTVTLTMSTGPGAAIVPDVTGLEARLAARIIEAAGLRLRRIDSVQAPAPRGVTVLSRPSPGTALTPGTGVVLTVSRGEATLVVPDVIGLSLGDAGAAIEAAGLHLGSSWSRPEPGATAGTVVEQRPAAGTLATPESPVDLIFASRPDR
jgi:serine/threonine-protein kinase